MKMETDQSTFQSSILLKRDSYPLIAAAEPWVHASKHSTIILTCHICAEDPYKVWWSKDGDVLSRSSHRVRQHKKSGRGHGGWREVPSVTLKIKSFRDSDFGGYRCNIYSNATKEEASSDVRVAGYPYPAVFDLPEEWSDTTFKLSWKVNCSETSPIVDYQLEFRRSSAASSDWIVVNIPASSSTASSSSSSVAGQLLVPNSAALATRGHGESHLTSRHGPTIAEFHQEYLLRGLSRGQNYEARVRSRNAYGASMDSEVFHFRTFNYAGADDDEGLSFNKPAETAVTTKYHTSDVYEEVIFHGEKDTVDDNSAMDGNDVIVDDFSNAVVLDSSGNDVSKNIMIATRRSQQGLIAGHSSAVRLQSTLSLITIGITIIKFLFHDF